MTTLRKLVVLVFLVVFVSAFALAALGGAKKIEMAEGALFGFFAVLVGQCITAIVVAFRASDFWKDDPNSIANLQRRHEEEKASLRKTHAEEIARMNDAHARAMKEETDRAEREAKESARLRAIIRPKPPGDQCAVSVSPIPRPRIPPK